MNDIVELLRDRNNPHTNQTMEDAATEIEWMREEKLLDLKAIKKLHDEMRKLRELRNNDNRIINGQQAEIERLHKEVANRAHSEEQYRAEIERLREDNGKLRAALIGQEVGLQSEIERLLGLLDECLDLLDLDQQSGDDACGQLAKRIREARGEKHE